MTAETDLLERYANRGEPRSADSILTHARQVPLPLYLDADDSSDRPQPRRRALVAAAVATVLVAAVAGLAARRSTATDPTPGAPTTVAISPTTLARPTPEELAAADQRRDELAARGWVAVGYPTAIPGEPLPEIAYRKAPIVPGGFNSMPFYVPDARGVLRTEIFDQPDGQIIGYYYGNIGVVVKTMGDDPAFDVSSLYAAKGVCAAPDGRCPPPALSPPLTVPQ
jgi:hypothetical protein